MKIIPTISKLPKLPLPIYRSEKIADVVSQEGEKFSILIGLDKKLVAQLKKLSSDKKDKELQENTGDKKRFGEGSYEDWYKKGRSSFALVHKDTNTLAAFVWFGSKALGEKSIKYEEKEGATKHRKDFKDGNWHTIAYRAYPNFRGKGLTKKFTSYVCDLYMKQLPDVRLWAGIDAKNKASKKLAESLGFKTLEKLSDREANFLVMVKY